METQARPMLGKRPIAQLHCMSAPQPPPHVQSPKQGWEEVGEERANWSTSSWGRGRAGARVSSGTPEPSPRESSVA